MTPFTSFAKTVKQSFHPGPSPKSLFILGNRLGFGLLILSLLSLYSHASLASQLSKITPKIPTVEASMFYASPMKEATKLAYVSEKTSGSFEHGIVPPPMAAILTEEEEEAGITQKFSKLEATQPAPRDRKLLASSSRPSRGLSALRGRVSLLMIPVRNSYISSRFGWRNGRPHEGTDFAAPVGTPIYASADGQVVTSGWSGGYGNMLIIDHGNGLKTRYGHCSKVLVSTGTMVRKGQLIGRVGSTGHSTGPHLHYEVIANGVARNPEAFLH